MSVFSWRPGGADRGGFCQRFLRRDGPRTVISLTRGALIPFTHHAPLSSKGQSCPFLRKKRPSNAPPQTSGLSRRPASAPLETEQMDGNCLQSNCSFGRQQPPHQTGWVCLFTVGTELGFPPLSFRTCEEGRKVKQKPLVIPALMTVLPSPLEWGSGSPASVLGRGPLRPPCRQWNAAPPTSRVQPPLPHSRFECDPVVRGQIPLVTLEPREKLQLKMRHCRRT